MPVSRFPSNYTRQQVAQIEDVGRELEKIERVLFDPPVRSVSFTKLYAAPAKPYDGLTVYADGTTWNPGAGQGIYTYYGAAWNRLG